MNEIIVCQFNIAWEDPERNCIEVERLLGLREVRAGSLIVLPEMFSTGFSMNVNAIAETEGEGGVGQVFLSRLAREYKSWVCAGLVFRDEHGRGRNCTVIFGPDGEWVDLYQKQHSFSFAGEDQHYVGGDRLVTFDWCGFRVCPVICYDLRFPELFRAGVDAGADAFVVTANWPATRAEHWRTLVRARAIENQAVVVACNRVGRDPSLVYSGDSMIVSAAGDILSDAEDRVGCIHAEVSLEQVRQWRETFSALADRKSF